MEKSAWSERQGSANRRDTAETIRKANLVSIFREFQQKQGTRGFRDEEMANLLYQQIEMLSGRSTLSRRW